jgi:acyl-CoA thioester hydrolase
MTAFITDIQLRWSDLDPNFHLRHSVYYDWGALCRIDFLTRYGLPVDLMQQLNIGPILFREECIFRKEVRWGDMITAKSVLIKGRKDFSRWSIQHTIYKNDEKVCAVITVDGAWLNTIERKLAVPPKIITDIFLKMPASDDFKWE